MEGHNLHYADKSIIHEGNLSQNSKTRLLDPRIVTVHPSLLSFFSPLCHLTTSGPSVALAEDLQPQKCPGAHEHQCLLHQGSIITHRRCGLVMISRDYGWLMVGKYIRNHWLCEGEGISLTIADLHWSTANEWGLAASSYLPTDK